MSARTPAPRDLPDHVAAGGEWKAWPRKSEAHLTFGARERQLSALCRSGRLVIYRCPDETLRLDPSVLEEEFGPPGVFAGRERQPADKAARDRKAAELQSEEQFDELDPLPGLVRELTRMLHELREEKLAVLKLVMDPMNFAIGYTRELLTASMKRTAELEAHQLEVMTLQQDLTDMRHVRDMQLAAEAAKEQRRSEVLGMLKQKGPALLDRFFATSDLASFVKGLNPEIVSAFIDSGLLDAGQVAILRRAAGVQPAANGKAEPAS